MSYVRIYKKSNPIKDAKFYAAWNAAHDYCQACGVPAHLAANQPHCAGVPLSTHHIVKFCRSDEATNLLRLCYRCHQLAEGANLRVDGDLLPKLKLPVCLTIKQARDPEVLNLERLAELFGRTLPDAEPIPEFIELSYRRWRPNDTQRR